ncbi:uncharacterized protein LOC121408987 isoform X1 [Lytechinus variegatus]|uniref:uncharacterized protein LOC121408987 isoform X1 n=1 Tax=Lytechinus variegatus TaxID=7654 RepID=UPI001BB1DFDC|nr:uncharacterized protein LOC121408987 isoform X1 [Lytechinus variegatus]
MKSCLRKHMEIRHKENERVRDALMKSKKLRDELFDKFRKEGILLFNKEESRKDNPKYLRERACQPENEKDQIVMCSVCHGFYRKIYLRKHMAKCKTHEPIRGAPIPMSLLSMNTSDQSVFAQEVLAKFRKSEVSTICKNDKVLLTIGRRLWEKKRKKINKDDNRKSVMTDMRRLGRLYLAFRKTEDTLGELPIKRGDISDVFQRENWVHLEQAVESCTIKEDGKTIKVALKLGLLYLIRNACKILKGTYLIQDEDSRAEDIDKFLSVLDLNQSYLFGDATYHVNKKRGSKLRRPPELQKEHVSQNFLHAGETNKNVYQAPLTVRELDVVGHRLESIHEESADQINVQSLHVDLMQALSKDNPNPIKVLKILDDVDKINSLNPSLLQAHPDFVKTIKQVCKYKFSDTVRERALSLFNKLKLISQQGTTDIADQVPNEDNECDDDDDSDEDYAPSSSKADLFDGDTRIMRSHTRRCLQDNAEPKQGYKQLKKSATVEAVEQIPLSKALEEKRKTSVKKKPYRYCIFCHKMKSCLRKHMEIRHKENERVRDALMKSKKLRDELFDKFRKEGILLFNKEESKKDNPKYLRERACQPENEKDQIVMCSVCHGFYRKTYLRKHMARCKTHEPIRGAPIPMSLLSMNTSDQSVFAQEVLAKFRKSEVSTICKNDKVLLTIGRRLWEKKRKKINKDDNRKSVMTDMRRLGRLYLEFRKTEDTLGELPIKRGDISDVFQRENWVHLEQAVESCTIKEDGKTIKVALKLGLLYLIRNACKILKGTYLIQDEDSRAEDIDKFLAVLDLNQSYLFGDATYHVNKKRKSKLRRPSESRKEHVSQHFQHAGETNKNVYQAPLTMRELDVVGHRLESIHEDGGASIVPVSEITHHDEILPPRGRAEVQAFLNTQVNFPHDLKTVQTKLKNEARKIKKRTVKKRKTL